MSDRISKFLRSLPEKQCFQLIRIIEQIVAGDTVGLDVKKLQGHDRVYRVRKGDFRVIYILTKDGAPNIIAAERRSDTTYRDR